MIIRIFENPHETDEWIADDIDVILGPGQVSGHHTISVITRAYRPDIGNLYPDRW